MMMESDDDLYDVDSVDDAYYDESDAAVDSDFMDSETEESDDDIACRDEKNYTILKEEVIIKRQNDDIATISSILSLSREEAQILLCGYNWDMNNVHEEWFADEERVRKKVGLLVKQKDVGITKAEEVRCRICFENYSLDKMNSAACGHLFCRTCWKSYVTISINDDPGCLMLRCPEPDCGVAVGKDMIEMLVSDEEKVKYQRYVLRSYVENSKKIKWCPAPDCDCAIEYVVGSGSYDVTCSCSYSFCWNCIEEAHQPVDCNTVTKWILKNKDEAENANWILVYTKPCPKCKQPIEKNQGCMHMTCTPPCKFQFCWLCFGPWKEHNLGTGGHYACNKFEAAKQKGLLDDEVERTRRNAKQSLAKYVHYYERWAENESSRQQARADLHVMQTEYLEKLSDIHCQTEALLKFIVEAWLQIIECRRVLKWTYAYGYYLPEHERAKKQLFEYLQGEAEANLERLHQCAEKDVEIYLDPDSASLDFTGLRTKLVDLTIVTRTYFENLVRALQMDLADVHSIAASSKTAIAKGREGGSKGKHQKGKESCPQEDEVKARVRSLHLLESQVSNM